MFKQLTNYYLRQGVYLFAYLSVCLLAKLLKTLQAD